MVEKIAAELLRSTHGVWLVALVAIVLTGVAGVANRWLSHQEIDRNARQSLQRQVTLVQKHIGDHVRDINSVLDETLTHTALGGRCQPDELRRWGRLHPEFRGITLIDADGIVRCASQASLVGADYSSDPRFKTVKAQPRDRVLLLAQPSRSAAGVPLMLFAKAQTHPLGQLQMLALVSMELAYYDDLLGALRGADQGIVLAHGSGLVLSRLPNPAMHRLKDLAQGASIFNLHRESGQPVSVTRAVAPFDGIDRYAATATVTPPHVQPRPAGHLVVGISDTADSVFALWTQQNLVMFGLWSLSSLAILGLALLVARRRKQLEAEVEQRRLTADYLVTTGHELAQQQFALDEHAIVSVADRAGNILSVNDKFCAISGYARSELIGANHRILNSGTHPPGFFGDMWQTIVTGKPWHGLICNRAKDGHLYWVNSSVVPIRDETGQIDRFISIRTDVTALIAAQAAVRKSEHDFRNIFEHLQDVYYRTDNAGRVVLVSPSVTALLQYTPDQMVGRPLADFWVEPDKRAAFLQDMAQNGGVVTDYEVCMRARDGATVWVTCNSHVYRGDGDSDSEGDSDGGNISGVEGMFHDVTRRKQLNEALLDAKAAADIANKAKSIFLSNMSHELRTPLNSVLGFSQLLQGSQLAPDVREDVDRIYAAGTHLLQLINEVLDLATVESGKITIDMQPCNATTLIDDALAMVRSVAAKNDITLDWQAPLDACLVHADRGRLKQAVLNLLSNAIKYNRPQGTVSIRIEEPGAGRVRINVKDTGIGLAAEQLQQLFTPFSRLGPKNIEGTGIGLTITRRIVELMGGSIGVESTPDAGSTFWIELAQAAALPLAAAAPSVAPPPALAAGKTIRGSVLYVEDNEANMQLMRSVLRALPGVQLLTAERPGPGLELARNRRPDLVLLDINLPDMDGYEVLKCLRANPATRDIPVVAVSANAMPTDFAAGSDAGFDDYLTKPLDIKTLLATVVRLLEPRQQRSP